MSVTAAKSFQCGKCKRKFVWKPELAGKRLRCKCGQAVSVPVDGEVALPRAVVRPAIPPSPPPVAPAPAFDVASAEATVDDPVLLGRPAIFLVMVIASVVVGAVSIWASWFTAADWAKAYRGSAPGSSDPWFPGDPQWMQALYFYSLASIGLAVCLIGAGAILMARPVLGVKLHLWYAVLKILFVLTEILLSVYYMMSVSDSGPSQVHFDVSAGTIRLIEAVVLESIYPIGIFAVLYASKTVKAYIISHGGFIGLSRPTAVES